MTTPLDIMSLAMRDAGILGTGQDAAPEDYNDAFMRTNEIIAEWAVKRWLVYHLKDLSKISTGANSYTIGPGGDFNISPRPNRLESAFLRQLVQSQPSQIDYPLDLILSREQYNLIALKKLQSFPSFVFYDTDWPVGTLLFYPVAQASIYEMHVTVKEVLSKFTSQTQQVNLPDEYMQALHWNLSVRLGLGYPVAKDPQVWADLKLMARNSLNTMRQSNNQISNLQMPKELVRPGIYNPFSDQIR